MSKQQKFDYDGYKKLFNLKYDKNLICLIYHVIFEVKRVFYHRRNRFFLLFAQIYINRGSNAVFPQTFLKYSYLGNAK